jgi:hypothetical protein
LARGANLTFGYDLNSPDKIFAKSEVSMLRRLSRNPIITPDMLRGKDGNNINGPSLIAAPEWLPQRLGNFYLYFAHHRGSYIRLAVADDLEGPWKVYSPGTLRLEDARCCRDHLASPDVHVDHVRREVRMFFHGVSSQGKEQLSFIALSKNGLSFRALETPLTNFYLRVTPWRNEWIGMTKGGVVYRSTSGITDFKEVALSFPVSSRKADQQGDVRHVALSCSGDTLEVFYTRIGDRPEHIRRALVDLSGPPKSWRALDSQAILWPEMQWEGANIPLARSRAGASPSRENAVRDPAIFIHDDRTFLLYSVAGESGIGIARLR